MERILGGTKELIQTFNEPYNTAECAPTSKIIWRKMNTKANLNIAIGDRLNKATAAWGKIRDIFITPKNIDRN